MYIMYTIVIIYPVLCIYKVSSLQLAGFQLSQLIPAAPVPWDDLKLGLRNRW